MLSWGFGGRGRWTIGIKQSWRRPPNSIPSSRAPLRNSGPARTTDSKEPKQTGAYTLGSTKPGHCPDLHTKNNRSFQGTSAQPDLHRGRVLLSGFGLIVSA